MSSLPATPSKPDTVMKYSSISPPPISPPPTNSPPRRVPFPHTVEVSLLPPALVFNFAHSGRTPAGDIIKATVFHESIPAATMKPTAKTVALPYPPGLTKVYFARAGNVGLEFESEELVRGFQESICGVGHVSVRGEAGVFRMYLGNKRVEEGESRYGAQVYGGQYAGHGGQYGGQFGAQAGGSPGGNRQG